MAHFLDRNEQKYYQNDLASHNEKIAFVCTAPLMYTKLCTKRVG